MYVHKSPGTFTASHEIPVLLVGGSLPSVGQYRTRSDLISEHSCTSEVGQDQTSFQSTAVLVKKENSKKCFPGFGC